MASISSTVNTGIAMASKFLVFTGSPVSAVTGTSGIRHTLKDSSSAGENSDDLYKFIVAITA
jgi:hypothetical protein